MFEIIDSSFAIDEEIVSSNSVVVILGTWFEKLTFLTLKTDEVTLKVFNPKQLFTLENF